MPTFRRDDFVLDTLGNAVAGAQVWYLPNQPGATASTVSFSTLSTIYSDATGSQTVGINPLVTDGFGHANTGFPDVAGYFITGFYTVVYTINNIIQQVFNDQLVGGTVISGTVDSVAFTAPSDTYTVTGSPVVSSGTIALNNVAQQPHTFYAGPSSGSAAAQSWRTIVVADLFGGTNASSSTFLRGDGTWATAGGTGTVTSIALTVPSWLTVAGSPITTSGTFAVSGTSLSQNQVLATPASGSGAVAPRALVINDLPFSGTPSSTTFARGDGSWATVGGGTGTVNVSGTPTNGQIAQWTNSNTIQGLANTGTGSNVLATSPTFVGSITTPEIVGAAGSTLAITAASGQSLSLSTGGGVIGLFSQVELLGVSMIFSGGGGISSGGTGTVAVGSGASVGDTSGTISLANLIMSGTLTDSTSSVGTNGQVLSSTATGTKWVTGGTSAWSALTNPTSNTTLNFGTAFQTTFDMTLPTNTSQPNFFEFANTTTATSSTILHAPGFSYHANGWNGSASVDTNFSTDFRTDPTGQPTGSPLSTVNFQINDVNNNVTLGQFAFSNKIICASSISAGTFVNAVSGYQVNGAAPSGHFLVGNGTDYVDGGTHLTYASNVMSLSDAGGTDIITITPAAISTITSNSALQVGSSTGSISLEASVSSGNAFWVGNNAAFQFTIDHGGAFLLGNSQLVGTAGQVLTTQGAGTAPTWTTVSGGGSSFSAITAGTNTAALVVGAAGSLTTTSTGIITATNGRALVNIKTEGAVGNGTTNDHTAIQAAFTATGSPLPGVYVPSTASSDPYLNSTAVTDPTTGDLQFVRGEGQLSGLITAGTNNLLTLTHVTDNNLISGFRIDDMSFAAEATPTSIGTQALVALSNANANSSGGDVSGLQINNVQFVSSAGPGLTVKQPILANIKNTTVFGSAEGIVYTAAGTTVVEQSTYMNQILGAGRTFIGQQAIALVGTAQDNCGIGTLFNGATGGAIVGCDSEAGQAWLQSITTIAATTSTITVTVANTYAAGQWANISGGTSTNAPLNGWWLIHTASATQFTVQWSGAAVTSNSPSGMKSCVYGGQQFSFTNGSICHSFNGVQMFSPINAFSPLLQVDTSSGLISVTAYTNNSAGVTNDVIAAVGCGGLEFHSSNFGAATEAAAIFCPGLTGSGAASGINYTTENCTYGAGNITPPIMKHIVVAGNPAPAQAALQIEDGTAFASSVPLIVLTQHNAGDTGNMITINNSGTSSNDIAATNWNMTQAGQITKYNGTALVERGVPSTTGSLKLTGQVAALSAHAFFTPAQTGFYRISINAKVTTASGSAGVLGGTTGCTLAFTDGRDSVAQTAFGIALNSQAATPIVVGTGNTSLTTQTQSYGDALVYMLAGVACTVSFGYTAGSGPAMAYAFYATAQAI